MLTAAARPPVPRRAARRLFACADFLLKDLYLEKGARESPNGDRPPSVHALVTECARALEQAHAPFAAFAAACASAIAAPAPAAQGWLPKLYAVLSMAQKFLRATRA